ncbi:MAG: hypothetical protein ACLQVL_14490 [Terriglobia bacterium]
MTRHRILHGLKVLLFVLLAATVFSFVVMWLWNRLVPAIFGLHAVSFWQALGLLILSKILFGGPHGRPGFGMHWRHRMMERWEQMTPEEREKFRAGIRRGCGPFGHPPAPPATSAPRE